MPGDVPLFDLAPVELPPPVEGARRRDDAIVRVATNADDAWWSAAMLAFARVATEHGLFTTDEVWAALDGAGVDTHEPRAMGAIVKRARAAGWIEPTGGYRESDRPGCHRRPCALWRSLVLGGTIERVPHGPEVSR